MKVYPFKLQEITLLDGPFKHARELDREYLLSLDVERLGYNFRITAGLPSTAEPYEGWEKPDCELRGHFTGHYLSACAEMYASTGDIRFKEKGARLVSILAGCQEKIGTGYVSAFPEEFMDRVESLRLVWAPWYTLHKIYAGLLDMYRQTGNQQALTVLERAMEWVEYRTGKLTEKQMQKMLDVEHGGMTDVLAELYEVTGEEKYLRLSKRFCHHVFLDPLIREEDKLTGIHANTQFPKVIGVARLYELTRDEKMHTAAVFFWNTVTQERSFVTGGNGDYEFFTTKEDLSKHVHEKSAETCNTHNMLKLTRHLFCWEPKAKYMDYYERGLYNHILASQNPDNGMMTYYVPLQTGCVREFSTPYDSFWCCVGTGVENHAKYGDSIYFHNDTSLYINLYIASELNWREKGVTLRQATQYPEKPESTLLFTCIKPVELTLYIRHPYWSTQNYQIMINGKKSDISSSPGSYVGITRTWKTGDIVQISMPMNLRTESFKDNPDKLAILYGPIVLSGDINPKIGVPRIVTDNPVSLSELNPVDGKPLTFQVQSNQFRIPGKKEEPGITLIPFYQQYKNPYIVYWEKVTNEQYKKLGEEIMKKEKFQQEINNRTIDLVQPGVQGSELEHGLIAEKSGYGPMGEEHWRDASNEGWFSYELKVLADEPVELYCTYWGSDQGNREFDILVEGVKVATQKLENNQPGELFSLYYPVPFDLTRGKSKITVKFQSAPGKIAGGLFGIKILKALPKPKLWTPGIEKKISKAYQTVNKVIAAGPYQDSWQSLEDFKVPKWYLDGKFGIFIHWGLYAVPGYMNEWYPRNMYIHGSREFKHHEENYGTHDKTGYKDYIPMFKAEKFEPADWADLFKKAGAKFVVPVAEHHDGFAMYDCGYSQWKVSKMGPQRDIIGELAKAIKKEEIVLGLSSHRAEHWWFMNGGMQYESDVRDPKYYTFYGPAAPDNTQPDEQYLMDWLIRTCELVDKYQPQLIYFDWWIEQPAFQPYLKKFGAYYYDRGKQWKKEVAINYKNRAYPEKAAVFDIERGQLKEIRPRHWQTDTAVSKNSWGYVKNQDYKTVESIIQDFVDIVSKNGALLLNIGPKPDGTIPDEEQRMLLEIGEWLSINGEGIYGTRPWVLYGEGPTKIVEGSFTDTQRQPFTGEDIRFTVKEKNLYAILLSWPGEQAVIKSLSKVSGLLKQKIQKVGLLGIKESLNWVQDNEGLKVTLPNQRPCEHAYVLKINT